MLLQPGCCNPLRICIGMINSPGIHEYAQYSTKLNYDYATKHGYDFIVNRCPDAIDADWKWDKNNQYVLVWYKSEFIKKYLPSYHYLVYIDSDAYFKDMNKKIEDFLREEQDDSLMYMAADCTNSNFCWNADGPNGGVIIVKNTPETFTILDDWINAPNNEMCEKWKYKHPREQQCLWNLKKARYDKEIKIIQPATRLGTTDGTWIVHLLGKSKIERYVILRSVYIRRMNKRTNYALVILSVLAIFLLVLCVLLIFQKFKNVPR